MNVDLQPQKRWVDTPNVQKCNKTHVDIDGDRSTNTRVFYLMTSEYSSSSATVNFKRTLILKFDTLQLDEYYNK